MDELQTPHDQASEVASALDFLRAHEDQDVARASDILREFILMRSRKMTALCESYERLVKRYEERFPRGN